MRETRPAGDMPPQMPKALPGSDLGLRLRIVLVAVAVAIAVAVCGVFGLEAWLRPRVGPAAAGLPWSVLAAGGAFLAARGGGPDYWRAAGILGWTALLLGVIVLVRGWRA